MDYIKELNGDIIIETLNFSSATMNRAEELKKVLNSDIENGWRKIVVDLTKCKTMDSTFLSTLVSAMKHLSAIRGELKIVAVNREIISLLDMTGTSKVLDIFPDKDSAVSSFVKSKKKAV